MAANKTTKAPAPSPAREPVSPSGTRPIVIACDHAGIVLKDLIVHVLRDELDCEVKDLGTFTEDSVDYPDYGTLVGEAVSKGEADRGILICGTGVGMSITANKFPGVRAALCHNELTARMAREHNDANVLVMGERVIGAAVALEMVRAWFHAKFEGGRHGRRLEKIRDIERKHGCV
jgi:ribose 5-phosphate isomerase B